MSRLLVWMWVMAGVALMFMVAGVLAVAFNPDAETGGIILIVAATFIAGTGWALMVWHLWRGRLK